MCSNNPASRWRILGLILTIVFVLMAGIACGDNGEPTPEPTPTLPPTPTPSPDEVLAELHYVITLDGELIATEEIRVGFAEDALVAFSELTRHGPSPATERRTVVLSPLLNPVRYSLEQRNQGVLSTWIAERDGEGVTCLNNNMAWYAPVLVSDVRPAPNIMLERAPSALPFALMALQFTEERPAAAFVEPVRGSVLDLTEDLPVSRPMTVSLKDDQDDAIIGTMALGMQIEGAANPEYTLWVRLGNRTLFGVAAEDYQFGFWEQMQNPAWREGGRLRIERVSHLPETVIPETPGGIMYEAIQFAGGRGERSGTLLSPEGQGPFPALLVHANQGPLPPVQGLETFVEQGWAVFTYDPAGQGESGGDYQRAPGALMAEDLRLAGEMLRAHPRVDAERIVLVALGDAAVAGTQPLADQTPFAAAVLGSFATDMPLFPDLAETRSAALGQFYGWSGEELAQYQERSIQQWLRWQFSGEDPISLLGRRIPLTHLQAWEELDLEEGLSRTQIPVLILHGQEDLWTPIAGAESLAARLDAKPQITFRTFDGLGTDLGSSENSLWADAVHDAVFGWLEDVLTE